MTGNYRLAVKLTHADIRKLFKTAFGSELNVNLLEEHGFTVSEDLKQAVLKTVKFADLTVGQLVSMTAPPSADTSTEDKPAPSAEVKPFIRRV
jgi:hypothetical protein